MRHSGRLTRGGQRQPGLQAGTISKKMLRNTHSIQGRYTIYLVILISFLGIALSEVFSVPYEITLVIISVILMAALINMNRIIQWTRTRQAERFQQQLAERQKERQSQ